MLFHDQQFHALVIGSAIKTLQQLIDGCSNLGNEHYFVEMTFKNPMSLACNKITCSLIQCQNRETYTDKLHIAPGISALRLKKYHIMFLPSRLKLGANITTPSPQTFGRLSRQCLQDMRYRLQERRHSTRQALIITI